MAEHRTIGDMLEGGALALMRECGACGRRSYPSASEARQMAGWNARSRHHCRRCDTKGSVRFVAIPPRVFATTCRMCGHGGRVDTWPGSAAELRKRARCTACGAGTVRVREYRPAHKPLARTLAAATAPLDLSAASFGRISYMTGADE